MVIDSICYSLLKRYWISFNPIRNLLFSSCLCEITGMCACGARLLYLLFFVNYFIILQCTRKSPMNKPNPRARMWGEKQLFPPNKIPADALSPKRSVVRRKLVLYHNFFRSKVRPTAANMLLMTWHEGAARQAQKYAERCKFLQHNDPHENTVPHLGACGQNLFAAAQKTPWFFAVKSWFIEYRNFSLGNPRINLHKVGHYTQMVWATSHKVGCGLAHCPGGPWGHFYNYVCHYCPGGNIDGITQYPYKPGRPCSYCPGKCISGKLCTNACYQRDYYSNCGELYQLPGACKQGFCNATCYCGSELIHKNYPF